MACSNGKAFFYNTLDGSKLIFDEPIIIGLTQRLLNVNELYSIAITNEEVSKEPLRSHIQQLRKYFMADIVNADSYSKKPATLVPRCKIVHDFEKFTTDQFIVPVNQLIYLSTLNLFLNYSTDNVALFNKNNLQFLAPIGGKSEYMLSLSEIKLIVEQAKNSGLTKLNIIIGNLSDLNKISEIINYLNTIPVLKSYYIMANDFLNNKTLFEKINNDYNDLHLIIDCLNTVNEGFLHSLTDSQIQNTEFEFVVRSNEEYKLCDEFIFKHCIPKFSFAPYFIKSNIDFFKENIFIDEDALFSEIHTMKSIFIKQKINTNFFGTLNILPEGDIYSNLLGLKHGNIRMNQLHEVIESELTIGTTWRNTRHKVEPCKNCVNNVFCPPISNYELVLNKYNLCNLFEN